MASTLATVAPLFNTQYLSTSADTYYTVPNTPATNCLARARLHFCNVTGGAITVTAYAVASGSTPGDHNSFVNAKSVAANDVYEVDVPMLGPNQFIAAKASANTSMTISATDGILFS